MKTLRVTVTDEDGTLIESWTFEADEKRSDVETAQAAVETLGQELKDGIG